MGNTADKLSYLEETKSQIKQAIINKGVSVSDSDTFREYAGKIGDISGGGGNDVITMDSSIEFKNSSTVRNSLVQQTLKTIDFTGCNFSKMTYMESSLSDFTLLEEVIFPSDIDTSKVTNMDRMFINCNNLTSLDVSSFNTSKVTSMSDMFNSCSNLTSLDVSSFDTSNVTNMSGMFGYCNNLTSLDVSSFNTSNVIRMDSMFIFCSDLTSLDVSSFDTSNVTNMDRMFNSCSRLTSLDLSSFNTSNVTNMSRMFSGCSKLTTLNLSSWNTSNVTNMGDMFYDCGSLTNVTWGNNWISNTSITSFEVRQSPVSHDSCLDLFNKLATRDNSPTLRLSTTTKGYMSEEEIAIATGKGWTVA